MIIPKSHICIYYETCKDKGDNCFIGCLIFKRTSYNNTKKFINNIEKAHKATKNSKLRFK